jgi:hypothetical protein
MKSSCQGVICVPAVILDPFEMPQKKLMNSQKTESSGTCGEAQSWWMVKRIV